MIYCKIWTKFYFACFCQYKACLLVCLFEREREKERESVCVCVREIIMIDGPHALQHSLFKLKYVKQDIILEMHKTIKKRLNLIWQKIGKQLMGHRKWRHTLKGEFIHTFVHWYNNTKSWQEIYSMSFRDNQHLIS